MPACMVCGRPAGQRCAGCGAAYYCGKDHQKLHWKQHKPGCSPVKEASSAQLGRYLAAARNLAVGEVVLREAPLIEAPPPSTQPVCLTCYKPLFEASAKECERCGWPMCGPECANNPKHRGECRLTVQKRGDKMNIRNFGLPHPSYQCIATLRCLALRDSSSAKWRRLLEMESHSEQRAGSPRQEQERFGVALFILRVFPKLRDIDKLTEEEILNICGILQVNGHEVPLSEPPYVAVYDKGSLLAHSCRANCAKSFSSAGELVVRTALPVKAGEPLTICYTDPMWGTAARRQHLYDTKFFWCRCERCVDPTEFGSYFSAIACPGGDGEQPDCPGAIMPDDPLVEGGAPEGGDPDMGEQQYWRCPTCDISMPQGSVLSLLRRVGEDLSELDKDDAEACRLFLQRYGGDEFPLDLKEKDAVRRPLLSRNHFYLTDVRLALAQRYGQDGVDAQQGLRQLSDGEIAHKRQLCRELLKLAEKLVPAEHRMRGLLWFELHAVEVEASRRRGLDQGPDPAALRVSLLESRRCLTEVIELLRCEPPELPEGKVLRQARLNFKEVDQLLCALHHAVGDAPL
ncbi:hypothetical protein FOCC_FOCC017963 [Frankliniella occidentalis]|nr:SET domain-containing protein SmydA-8-like [Frankliniella occidentalis]KAE8736581.1 hypothetical protein FOCC_FOCC017963 [Frankliniella occidentalis]